MRGYIVLALLASTQLLPTEGVNIGANCDASLAGCPDHAACTAANTACVCNNGYTAKSDNTACLAKAGTACASTGAANDCIPNASCASNGANCACSTGYTANTDSSQCNSAVAGVASLALVLAAFVTSRFL